MSQQELAETLAVSRRAITNWETGAAEPRGRNINSLDRVLGDATTPEVGLHDATVMELLAELAGRYASLEAVTKRGDEPTNAPERYTWSKRDAPTARRSTKTDRTPGERDESG